MTNGRLYLFLLLSGLFATAAFADEVRKIDGDRLTGNIASITADEVEFKGNKALVVPTSEILAVAFTNEPNELDEVREMYHAGRYDGIEDALSQVKEARREEMKAEIAFYRAAAQSRLAAAGNADQKSAVESGKALLAFIKQHPDSWHNYEAHEIVGDLLTSIRNAQAFNYYDKLSASRLPDYKIRAHYLKGRALQSAGNYAGAIQHFDAALQQSAGESATAQAQLALAQVGKAASLAHGGKADEALQLLQQVVDKARESDHEVFARAYNAMGDCYQQKKAIDDAILSYLKVELLFNQVPDAHAEALAKLSKLWEAKDERQRARATADTLRQRYAYSRWNRDG
jgi:tetratricopeptide (TPR) repeat protein